MRTLQTFGVVTALGLVAAVAAQSQTSPEAQQSASPESGQTQQQPGTPQGQPSPAPSTSPTEGTAADTTPPGQTPTRPQAETRSPTVDPRPSTSPAEGTAADTTPPGETPTGGGAATGTRSADEAATGPGTARTAAAGSSRLVGVEVVSMDDAPLGKVVDVVADSAGQPEFVVISTQSGATAAVPYSAVSGMIRGEKLVMDQTRLESAPRVEPGEWRSGSGAGDTWRSESERYWSQGGTRSASPGTGDESGATSGQEQQQMPKDRG